MNTSQNIGRIARYIGAIYLLLAGLFSLISKLIELLSLNTSMLSVLSVMTSLFISLFWLYAAYVLFRNLRNKFAGIIGMLLFSGIIALAFSFYQEENLAIFATLAVVTVLIILIIISWKMESGETKTTVDRAREFFGKHISHLPNEEVRKILKQ